MQLQAVSSQTYIVVVGDLETVLSESSGSAEEKAGRAAARRVQPTGRGRTARSSCNVTVGTIEDRLERIGSELKLLRHVVDNDRQ